MGVLWLFLILCVCGFQVDSALVVSGSSSVRQDDNTPQGLHLSLTQQSSEMVVTWSTQNNGSSVVFFGSSSANYTNNQTGYVTKFTLGNSKGLQYVHRVTLTELTPGTKYYYKAQTDEFQSAEFSFRTLESGSNWSPTFLIYGDMGTDGSIFTRRLLEKEVASQVYTALFHVGDFAYDLFDWDGQRGDQFFSEIEPFAANIPYMTCVGNHEIGYNFSAYINKFTMPGTSQNMWYSINIGPIHFVAYSTEVYFVENGLIQQQYEWLENDLQQANKNRNSQPWIIAFGHRPMYCSNIDHDDCTTPRSIVRAGLEKLFYEQGVDIILEAHEHSYERLWPVYNETVTNYDYNNPKAPVHLISGTAGCNEQLGICENPILGPKGPWSAFREWLPGTHGFAVLQVENGTINWKQIKALDNSIQDSITITQTFHGPRNT